MASLLDLIDAFKQDPDNPFIRKVLDGAKEEFAPPPAGGKQDIKPYLDNPLDAQGAMQDATSDPSMPLGGMDEAPSIEPPQSTEGDTQAAVEQGEEEPGYFGKLWRDNKGDIAKLGITAASGLFGEGGREFGQGFGQQSIKDMQIRQAEKLQRRQRSWEDAYNDARSIPSEVLENPAMSELAEAHKALLKDMEDGKVDNEKNISNFLMLKSQYKDDIEQAQLDKKIQQEQQVEDARAESKFKQRFAEHSRLAEIANAPPGSVPQEEQQLAQRLLAERSTTIALQDGTEVPVTPAEKLEYEQRQQRWQRQDEDRAFNRQATSERLGIAREGLEMRGEELESRRGERKTAAAAKHVGRQVEAAVRAAQQQYAVYGDPDQPFNAGLVQDQALIQAAPIIEQATGFQVIPPETEGVTLNEGEGQWTIVLFGQPHKVPFDPNTTEGKMRALRMANAQLQAQGASPGLGFLSMGAGYGE